MYSQQRVFPCGRINFQAVNVPVARTIEKNSDSFRASSRQKKMTSTGQKTLRSYLPIEITAQHAGTGKIMAGPLRGRLFDLSKNNACLLMSEIMDDKYHLFYSTQEDNLIFLNLFFDLPPALDQHLQVPAIPLWFNIFQQGQIRNFIMGVEFTQNIEEKIMRQLLAGVAQHRKGIS